MFKVLIFACVVAYATASSILAAPYFAPTAYAAPFAYERYPLPLAYSKLAAPLTYSKIETPTAFTTYNSVSTPDFHTQDFRADYRPLTYSTRLLL